MSDLRRSQFPNDVGLLQDTFIPVRNNFPSWKQPLKRLRVEWLIHKSKVQNFAALWYLSKWSVPRNPETGKWEYKPLELVERYENVRKLHKELYTALAEREIEKIEDIACTGLKRQLSVTVDKKKAAGLPKDKIDIQYIGRTFPTRKYMWLVNLLYPGQAAVRILSDRQVPLPFGGQQASLRQIVARVRSKQTLTRGETNLRAAESKTEDKIEYVVIQRMNIENEKEDWKIWGTTQPLTEAQIEEMLARPKSANSVWDRIKAAMSGAAPSASAGL